MSVAHPVLGLLLFVTILQILYILSYTAKIQTLIVGSTIILKVNDSRLETNMSPCRLNSSELGNEWEVIDRDINEQELLHLAAESHIKPGGHFVPAGCTPRQKVAVIVPYRDRKRHLKIFLSYIHPMLQNQSIEYTVFVVEQNDTPPGSKGGAKVYDFSTTFNRGMMRNIGFVEARKLRHFDCFVFNDVDTIPETDRVIYMCSKMPRHLASEIDIFDYRLPYVEIFGGSVAMTASHMLKTNGYSNVYFGWGAEDDDLFSRIRSCNMNITRYPPSTVKFKMLKHKLDRPSVHRNYLFTMGKDRWLRDGLNSLEYTILKVDFKPLYTRIYVTINRTAILTKTLSDHEMNFYKELVNVEKMKPAGPEEIQKLLRQT